MTFGDRTSRFSGIAGLDQETSAALVEQAFHVGSAQPADHPGNPALPGECRGRMPDWSGGVADRVSPFRDQP